MTSLIVCSVDSWCKPDVNFVAPRAKVKNIAKKTPAIATKKGKEPTTKKAPLRTTKQSQLLDTMIIVSAEEAGVPVESLALKVTPAACTPHAL